MPLSGCMVRVQEPPSSGLVWVRDLGKMRVLSIEGVKPWLVWMIC